MINKSYKQHQTLDALFNLVLHNHLSWEPSPNIQSDIPTWWINVPRLALVLLSQNFAIIYIVNSFLTHSRINLYLSIILTIPLMNIFNQICISIRLKQFDLKKFKYPSLKICRWFPQNLCSLTPFTPLIYRSSWF